MLRRDQGPFWSFLLPAGWQTTSHFYENAGQVAVDPDDNRQRGRVTITHYQDLRLRGLDEAESWCRQSDAEDVAAGALIRAQPTTRHSVTVGGRPGRLCTLALTLPDGTDRVLEQWLTLGRDGSLLRIDAYQFPRPRPE